MKGCELHGRYVFFDAAKNARLEGKRARRAAGAAEAAKAAPGDDGRRRGR
jgi:hypothetical protein